MTSGYISRDLNPEHTNIINSSCSTKAIKPLKDFNHNFNDCALITHLITLTAVNLWRYCLLCRGDKHSDRKISSWSFYGMKMKMNLSGCKRADTVYSATHNHKQNMHLSFTLSLKLLQKAGQISGFNSCKINTWQALKQCYFTITAKVFLVFIKKI